MTLDPKMIAALVEDSSNYQGGGSLWIPVYANSSDYGDDILQTADSIVRVMRKIAASKNYRLASAWDWTAPGPNAPDSMANQFFFGTVTWQYRIGGTE